MQMQPNMRQPMLGGVPGGNQFHFFPMQVGGPTDYARSRKWLFLGVSVYQLMMAVMAIIEFANFLSGFLMLFGCMIAWWAFKEDLNITYICWWGIVSTAGFVAGVVGALIGFAIHISTIVIKFNIPLACFFGMALAWLLFADYEANHPESNDMFASWCKAFGLLKPSGYYQNSGPPMMSKGQLPQFGGSGNFDGMQNQAAAYGTMGAAGFAAAQAKAQEGGFASSFGAFGSSPAAVPAPARPLQPGAVDTRRDPFMSQ